MKSQNKAGDEKILSEWTQATCVPKVAALELPFSLYESSLFNLP